jgi:hypothetical protein
VQLAAANTQSNLVNVASLHAGDHNLAGTGRGDRNPALREINLTTGTHAFGEFPNNLLRNPNHHIPPQPPDEKLATESRSIPTSTGESPRNPFRERSCRLNPIRLTLATNVRRRSCVSRMRGACEVGPLLNLLDGVSNAEIRTEKTKFDFKKPQS